MFDSKTVAALAKRLNTAEKTRTQTRQISLENPGMTIEDAYQVQKAWVELKLAEGRTVKGHKIGLTSKAMQMTANINEPDFGVLLDDMFYPEGSDIPFERFIVPRVEVELGFVLKEPLCGPNCTIFDVLQATEYVIPALEIIDARIERIDQATKITRKVFDTISDNAANAAVVMGGRPVRPMDVDLRWVSALCYRNGQVEESGVAAAVMNHPAKGIAWLVNKLSQFGVSLEAGEFVLAGSFTRPLDIVQGDTFHVDYGPMGSVPCRFV